VSERAGFRFISSASQTQFDELTRHPDLWHSRKGLMVVLQAIASHLEQSYSLVESAYEPGRTVIVAHGLAFSARMFEEKHGAPAATVHLAPSIFRSCYQSPAPAPGVDTSRWPAWVKRSIFWLIDRWLIDPPIAPALNQLRRRLGLPPVSRVFNTWLHSPRKVIGLFPPWFAEVQPDWPQQLRLTGFPLYDEADAHTVSADLDRFLNDGAAPVLFTPGSANRAADAFFAAAVEASKRIGRRALLLTGYPEHLPTNLGPDVRHERYVPFSHVLPRCAAVVHHAGIGTSAQALAAGIPQLTMPMGFDQPDNTTRLWRLGVARWVPPSRFTGERVARELAALLDDGRTTERCQHWAREIRRGDALGETCATLESLISPASIGV
jgi:UDP:flavonoid glycosyltransferase YjiC (YdhE family)